MNVGSEKGRKLGPSWRQHFFGLPLSLTNRRGSLKATTSVQFVSELLSSGVATCTISNVCLIWGNIGLNCHSSPFSAYFYVGLAMLEPYCPLRGQGWHGSEGNVASLSVIHDTQCLSIEKVHFTEVGESPIQ